MGRPHAADLHLIFLLKSSEVSELSRIALSRRGKNAFRGQIESDMLNLRAGALPDIRVAFHQGTCPIENLLVNWQTESDSQMDAPRKLLMGSLAPGWTIIVRM